MKKRIQYLYEKGETSYLELLMEAKSWADMLNKAEYVQEIYTYDRKMLDNYAATVQAVSYTHLKDAATSSESSDTLFNSGKTASYINMSTPGTREAAERDSGLGVVQLNMCPTYMTTNVYTGVLFFVPKRCV